MSRVLTVPRAALFLAGAATVAISRAFKTADERDFDSLKNSISDLERRLANQEALHAERLNQLEAKVVEQEKRLNDVPSTSQIVAAMETLLSKTMTSLDARLSAQAHSIDVLKTTVSQTDELLERVLESIDRLKQTDDDDAPILAGSTR
jgi:uncharacterized coiled-coil protein SlyX